MFRRIQRTTNTGISSNTELVPLESSVEDLTSEDGVTTTLQHMERPVTQFQLPLDQQERLKLIEHWRQQDEKLYPRGFERRRSSADNILEVPTTPVIELTFLLSLHF